MVIALQCADKPGAVLDSPGICTQTRPTTPSRPNTQERPIDNHAEGDHGSRDLLAHILEEEEDHANWLETQLGLIAQLGEAHYLAQQVRS
jgi:hypothetical protein